MTRWALLAALLIAAGAALSREQQRERARLMARRVIEKARAA